jgi:hypothetical protein
MTFDMRRGEVESWGIFCQSEEEGDMWWVLLKIEGVFCKRKSILTGQWDSFV